MLSFEPLIIVAESVVLGPRVFTRLRLLPVKKDCDFHFIFTQFTCITGFMNLHLF